MDAALVWLNLSQTTNDIPFVSLVHLEVSYTATPLVTPAITQRTVRSIE